MDGICGGWLFCRFGCFWNVIFFWMVDGRGKVIMMLILVCIFWNRILLVGIGCVGG